MSLLKGKSEKSFSHNVSEMVKAGHPQDQSLAAAYAMKRKSMKMNKGAMCAHGGPVHCNAGCYAKGGLTETDAADSKESSMYEKNYARGGEVTNEKLHPEHEEPMPEGMREDLDAMEDEGEDQSEKARLNKGGALGSMSDDEKYPMSQYDKYAHGGNVVDEIMHDRKKMAKGGTVEMDPEEDQNPTQRMNLEREHFVEDKEHEINPDPSEDDMSLIGEIIRERKMRRRG